MLKKLMRAFSLLSGLVAIGACTAASSDTPAAQAASDGQVAAASAAADVVKVEPVKPAIPLRSDFEFNGSPRQGGIIVARTPTGISSVSLDGKSLPITDDGYVLLGFNRDAEATAVLSWTIDGAQQSRNLSVKPGKWRIERVNLSLPRGRKASQRRAKELTRIGAARAQRNQSDGWRQDFIWPVKGRLSGFFGAQRYYRGTPGGYHTGLDIAAPNGTVFVAPADGLVTLASQTPFSREGYLLMVDHGMGLNSAFVHCAEILVKEGDRIKQGQVIARVGRTGSATGPHLHWSMMWNASRVDPLLMLPPA